ncbi:MAG: HDOD domain-containing protein [Deltaproteobacteria bacterium]|nr:HDOD domain-containing protein [Deltaproteobacteria bacterium]
MEKTKSKEGKHQIPSFQGLSEAELKRLYSLARIRKLQPDEVLIREGDTDQTVYIVLEGQLRVVKKVQDGEEVIATLGRDSWIGEIAFTRKIPRTASAIADKPSLVMVIEKATLDALEEKTQLFFFKRLNDLAFERIRSLELRERDLAGKNRRLRENLVLGRIQTRVDYGRSETVQTLLKKIPKLPVFASSLAVKLLEEEVSAAEIADMVKGDPSLVGVVLKTVNSPYYGFQKKISDINHAVVLLGFNQIHQLLVSEGVRRTMPDTPVFRELHAHSNAISQISFAISQTSGVGKPSQAATIGLLHDLGRGVLELLKEQNPKISVLLEGVDHSQMGSLLLRTWNLPDLVWKSVESQCIPEYSPPSGTPLDVRIPVATLYLAHLAYAFLQGKPVEEMPTPYLEEYATLFRWERLDLTSIVEEKLHPSLTKRIETLPVAFRELLKSRVKG